MAKTTSQIVAENKIKRAEEAEIRASRDAIHRQQMKDASALKTANASSVEKNTPVTTADKKAAVQQKRDAAEFAKTETAKMPTTSEIRADAAKKQLQRYQEKYDQKTKARAEKQKKDQLYSDLITGNPDIIVPADAPDDEEKQLKEQVDRWQQEADYWDGQIVAERDEKITQTNLDEIEAMSEDDRAAFEKYMEHGTYVNPADIDAYKALAARYGSDHLKELEESYNRNKNTKKAGEIAEKTAEKVDTTGGKVLHSVLSVPASIAGGVAGTAARIDEMFNRTGQYETLSPYTLGDLPNAYAQTVQEKTVNDILGGQELDVMDGVSGREVGALAYQGVMGAAQTGGRLLAAGGNPLVAAGLAATQSFSNTVQQATAQGASPEQAYTLATVNAGIEAATEKIPLDELFKVAKGGAKPAAQGFGNILKSAGIEAATEEISLVGTILAEAAILQEKSSYNQQVMMDVLIGKSLEQAKQDANRALLAEAINTAIVSGISGVLSAGGAEIMAARNGGVQGLQQAQTEQKNEQVQKPAAEAVQAREAAPAVQKTETDAGRLPRQGDALPRNDSGVRKQAEASAQNDEGSAPVVDTKEQSAESGQVKGSFEAMGAADQNFSGKPAYNSTLSADNAQPDRAGDVRPMELPQTDINGGRISAVTGNVYGAGVTPDEFASLMEEPTARGDFSYMPISNNQATQAAMENISRYGWQDAYMQWHDAVRAGNAGAEMSARGALFLNHAAQAGDREQWLNILSDFQRLGTNTAQGLQAFRILRNLAPSDRLYMIRRSVQQMVDDMHLRVPVQIDQQMADAYQNAQTNEEADRILDQIIDDVAAQIPSTAGEQWTALRYMNMLGNFRTQVRNISGNVGAKLTYLAKDQIGAALEKVAHAFNPNLQRTKSNWVGNDLKALGRQDFDEIRDILLEGGRFDDARRFDSTYFAREVNQRRRIFNNRLLEGYRRLTNWAMNNDHFGDAWFARSAYARAFGGYLKANGFHGNSLDGINQDLLDNARVYAIQQAQESTFRDHNAVSDWIGRIGRRPDTPRAARALAEGIMPFRSTPANVLVRAEEYSPLGILNTAVTVARRVAGNSRIAEGNGAIADWARAGREISGTDVVESLAKTLTGTGIFMLGAYLGKMGMLTGGPDPDDDKEEFDELNGYQNYALQLPGGENITIDFLSPVAVPMFLGAEFEKIISDGGYDLADYEKVFTSLADPLIQMSMLQGLNDTLDDIKYSQNNLGQFLLNASMSYLTQGLTNTLLGQMERSTEDTRQTTYVDKDSATPLWLQRQLGKASQKIPGWDYQQTDYINARGETEAQRTDVLGWLYNLVSPGYIDRAEVDEVSKELYRLNEAGVEGNVFPTAPETMLTWTDKRGTVHKDYNLTAEQAETLKRETGQISMRIIGEMVSSRVYKALTDEQKAKAIQQAYSYARETGEIAAIGEDHTGYSDAWMMELTEGGEARYILRKVAGSEMSSAMAALNTAWDKGYDEKPRSDDLKWAYDTFKAMTPMARNEVKEWATGSTKNYIEARESGISHEKYVDTARLLDGLVPETGREGIRSVQKAETIAGSKKLTESEKVTLIKQQVSDSQDENIDELKAMGYDVEMYVRLYRDHEDYTKGTGKKARTTEKWMKEFGIDKKTARALYEVFS